MTSPLARSLRSAEAIAHDLARQRRLDDAVHLYDRMLAVAPGNPSLLLQQGSVLLLADDSARAERHFRALTQTHPGLEDAWQGLGKALYDQHRCEEAIQAFTQAAARAEAPARALYHRGLAHLLAGDFAAGWRDYEHRLTVPTFRHRVFDRPRWDGAALGGRRLLVILEQGYGDVFQFARFLPRLRGLGGPVIVECPDELRDVLAPLMDGLTVVPPRGREAPDIAFDCYVSLLSLPRILRIGLADLEGSAPYLTATAPSPHGGLRVGVCWAGKPSHPQDTHRSMDPEFLAPLASVPGVMLVSLQKDTSHRPALPGLCDFIAAPDIPLTDFAATSRLMASLDLIVTVDTSVAHLAGALGRPVWLLLSRAGEWRWLKDRPDSPWYPSMRIFRQSRQGDWSAVIAAAREALTALSAPPTISKAAERPALEWLRSAERHHAAGRLDAALDCYARVLTHEPDNAEALHMRGVARMMQGLGPEGVADIRSALALQPGLPNAWRNLSHYFLRALLHDNGTTLWDEAEHAARRAVETAPEDAACWYQRAAILLHMGRHADAIEAAEHALRLNPNHVSAHMTRALARLVTGDLRGGFEDYEWRWKLPNHPRIAGFDPNREWRGDADINGRTLLLHAEQGHGDTIQMVRYIPLLLQLGARIVLLAHPGLKRLLAETTWGGDVTVLSPDQQPPAHDLHCPLLSLPRVFGTIPAEVPYLHAPPDRISAWRRRLDALPASRKVGIVWTGDPAAMMNARRSVPLPLLAPLSTVPNVTLVSLQKNAPSDPAMQDWTGELDDFADTAALVMALDLVIAVDTAVAHLAGALGRPVWLLNRRDTDWRWLLDRDDSPWYPTLRQFRQTRDGDWPTVIDHVRQALCYWADTA